MECEDGIGVMRVGSWDVDEIAALYREGGWWKEEWDPEGLHRLISGSFVFVVAVDAADGKAVGMGRAISDGTSDAYIQDLVVSAPYRYRGIGRRILRLLTDECLAKGLVWIGLIAGAGTTDFYRTSGFKPMKGFVPMLHDPEADDVIAE